MAMKKIIIVITLILLNCSSHVKPTIYQPLHQELFDQINFAEYDKIMIVAHPDDETIWGGMHLLQDKYFVICLTNGNNKVRANEFMNVLKNTASFGIILDYPDKVNGKKDNWATYKNKIRNDLYYVLSKHSFNLIVTHNPDGEYGHIHHKMTNSIVTKIQENLHATDKLYYFGKYHKKNSAYLPMTPTYDAKLLEEKNNLLKLYSSQKKVCKHLQHMFPYEYWISYQDWS